VNNLKVGRRPRTIAWMPNGRNVWVNAENDGTVVYVDTAKNEVVETVSLGEAGVVKPMAVLLSNDSSKLYVSTGRGKKVFVLDTATRKVESSFEVGQRPWGIALSPDGKTLYTANGPSNDLSVVDLATKTVTKKVMLTGSPWGIVVLPPTP
jgi:YVTN family beta-propeller protein